MILLPDSLRSRHIHIWGPTQTGKTTLLLNMLRQDIAQGKAVGFLDPHGSAADTLVDFIPPERLDDLVYFNPPKFPIGLNPLVAGTPEEQELVADDLLVTFRRSSDSWGPRMDTIFRYSFATLLRIPGSTLLDIIPLLTDKAFRQRDLPGPIKDFWDKQFPHYPKDAAQPILDRLTRFHLNPAIGTIFANPTPELTNGIFIANLGNVGEDTAQFLGTTLVSLIQLKAMRTLRSPFHLYVDEFHRFTTSAFERILSEAAKFKLYLTLVNQHEKQLDGKLLSSLQGNVGTRIQTLPGHQLQINFPQSEHITTGYPLPPKPYDHLSHLTPLGIKTPRQADTVRYDFDNVKPSEPPET